MTNEEKVAEKIICNKCSADINRSYTYCTVCTRCDDFIKGLAEGKPKWHDLRKDPNDLPKESGEYWTKWEDGAYSTVHYFADYGFGSYVIAWCELPRFEEN